MDRLPDKLAQEQSLWRARFAAIACVIVTGVLLGGAGYTIICLGPVLGFATGALTARAAASHKFWFGLLAVGITIVANVAEVRILDWRSGYTPAVREWRFLIPMMLLLVGMPGLVGSATLAAVGRRDQAAFSQDLADRGK